MKPLTKDMQDALLKAKACNGLIRWPGGFWSGENTPTKVQSFRNGLDSYMVPEWWIHPGTIQALVRRGLLKETKFMVKYPKMAIRVDLNQITI